MVAMGVGVLIGALAGLYFRVFFLAFLTILALLGTAVVDVANGLPLRITLVHMAYIWGGLQFAYFGSSFFVSRSQREFRSTEPVNVPNSIYVANQNALRKAPLSKVREPMEVHGAANETIAASS